MTAYKVSVIVINYNKENYIEECLRSVAKQSLNQIECVIVDDGSTDGSLDIIEKFVEKHKNFKLVKQANSGPSAARNNGIKNATGEYLAFLDGDDWAFPNAYEQLYKLAKKHQADSAVGNILCFNEMKSYRLNYMNELFLRKLPVVRQILKNSELVKTPSASNKLFKRDMIVSNQILFDTDLRVGEDLLFTQKGLIQSNKTVVKDIDVIGYRVNDSSSSLIKAGSINFFIQLVDLQQKLSEYFKSHKIQDQLIHIERRQLQFFIDSIFLKGNRLPDDEKIALAQAGQQYLAALTNQELLVNELNETKAFLCHLMNQNDGISLQKWIEIINDLSIQKENVIAGDKIYSYLINYFPQYKDQLIINDLVINHVLEDISLHGDRLTIRGYAFIKNLSTEDVKKEFVFRNQKGNEKIIELRPMLRTDVTFMESKNTSNYNWAGYETVDVSLLEVLGNGKWDLFIRLKKDRLVVEQPVIVFLTQHRNKMKPTTVSGKQLIAQFRNLKLSILIRNKTAKNGLNLWISNMKRTVRSDAAFLLKKDFHSLFAVILYKLFGWYFRSKKIWLVGERRDTAQDNSYHLYKYIRTNHPEINCYYIIDKNSPDYRHVQDLGNIIQFGSFLHSFYMLVCIKTINSYAEHANMYTQTYKNVNRQYPEWQQNKKIFIQHGVIGVSRVNQALNKNEYGYSLFVTSSEFERNHIIEEFGYKEDEVVVTGLARWDALKDTSTGNEILFMPTWRNWIKSRDALEDSRYMKSLILFLSNKKLHHLLEKYNKTITFYPHYQTQLLWGELPFFHERIHIVKQGEETVQNLLKRHSLLITDYSTVSFDFVYMEKPVIFYQFDYDEFYSRHYNEGPINHKTDLFGKACDTEDEVLSELERIINHNMKIDEDYLIKSNKFMNRNNSLHTEAIFHEILKRT
ncbi:teichoic acid biosynthesis protein B [Bacillus sp. AFS002410]|uniref:bifunctional glycosyltransferase/CDP-glycerol:glycerophosphate glycerophosphotransferase n=1 Tax=Bacillus sp. AFS002410 TaxID=2033481 RepID=UPI000BF07DBD|nr:glycosyltransferase [Bacillus sp. AFS002410]PEJ59466.1 teichoic acid biosynthesis protein B [Bacillus sp. AFS002410]